MTGKYTGQPRVPASNTTYGYVVVAAAFIIMTLASGLFVVFGVFFDPLLLEFGWSRAAVSGGYSLAWVLSGALAIFAGGLSDRFGPRLVVTFCGVCLGLGYLLMSRVDTLWQFYLFYGAIIGAGMSGIWVPLLSAIVRWFTVRRSLMTGIVLSGLTAGQLIAPPIISRLIIAHGWRTSYIILGAVLLVVIVIAAQFLKRESPKAGQLPDDTEEAKQSNAVPDSSDFNLREAFRTRQFWLVAAIFFCVGFASFTFTVHIVPHATLLGYSSVVAANILAINGGIGIIGNFMLGGIIGDRMGNRKAFIIGAVLMAVSLFLLIPLREVWLLYIVAIIFGIGLGGMGTSESPLIASLFGSTSHGLIYAVIALAWTVGAAVGPVIAGYMCDVLGDYQLAFLVSAIISAICFLVLLMLRPTKRRGIAL